MKVWLRKLVGCYAGSVVAPSRTMTRLLDDPQRVSLGAGVVGALGVAYTGVVAGLAYKRVPAKVRPALPVAREDYYRLLVPATVPVFVGAWLLMAGSAHGASRLAGGSGWFGDTLSATSLAFGAPWLFTTWTLEAVLTGLYLADRLHWQQWFDFADHHPVGRVLAPGYQLAGLVWSVGLAVLAVKQAQRMSWGRTAAATGAGLVPTSAWLGALVR